MKVLFEALYTKFSGNTNFKNAVGSQFYPGMVDQENATYPYAAYYLISDFSNWTFTEDIEELTIQISVYSNKNSPSEILTIFEYQKALFDNAILSVTGYTFVKMHRQGMTLIRDEAMNTFHMSTDYDIELHKQQT